MPSDIGNEPTKTPYERILDEVEVELTRKKHALEYFKHMRFCYADDLAHIAKLYCGGPVLEIGGFPFCFSLSLQKPRESWLGRWQSRLR